MYSKLFIKGKKGLGNKGSKAWSTKQRDKTLKVGSSLELVVGEFQFPKAI